MMWLKTYNHHENLTEFFYKNIQNHYHQRLILRRLKCIKSITWLTYLAISTIYMFYTFF